MIEVQSKYTEAKVDRMTFEKENTIERLKRMKQDPMKEVLDVVLLIVDVLTQKRIGLGRVKVRYITFIVWTAIAMVVYIIAHIGHFLDWYGDVLAAVFNFFYDFAARTAGLK